ncbi:MAG: ATP-binding protein, partial [Planctomycetota bacterium]
MKTETIQATVNPRLLQKASRLFTGTIEGRIIEVLQNARRAEATEVQITNADSFVTVRDNGRGIEEFQKLLDLGSSGWDDTIELSEDPAGVGLFSLAPRKLTIRSQGRMLTIRDDGWTGTPVDIENDSLPIEGTELRFPDERWTLELVSACAVFSGLRVVVDGEECPRLPFVSDSAAHR